MAELTKEQKMKMISDAIDAGFKVEIKFHGVETMEEMNEKLDIFPNLPVEFDNSDCETVVWAKVNGKYSHEDKFGATIFFK